MTKPKMGRRRARHIGPVRRRPEVIELAARYFAEHGYRASMIQLATEAGVAKAVLYDCFLGGKTELQEELIERAIRLFHRSVIDALSGARSEVAELVGAAVGTFVAFAKDQPHAFELLFGPVVMDGDRAQLRLLRARARMDAILFRRLRVLLAQTGIRPLRGEIHAIIGMATSMGRRALGSPGTLPDSVVQHTADIVAHGILRGKDDAMAG